MDSPIILYLATNRTARIKSVLMLNI